MLFRIVGPSETERFQKDQDLSLFVQTSLEVPPGSQIVYEIFLESTKPAHGAGRSWVQSKNEIIILGEGSEVPDLGVGSYELTAKAWQVESPADLKAWKSKRKTQSADRTLVGETEAPFIFTIVKELDKTANAGSKLLSQIRTTPGGGVPVELQRVSERDKGGRVLWAVLARNADQFERLKDYLDKSLEPLKGNSPFQGVDVYARLRKAIEAWMMVDMTTIWDVSTIKQRLDDMYGKTASLSVDEINSAIEDHFVYQDSTMNSKLTGYLRHILNLRPEHSASGEDNSIERDPYITQRLTEPALCELVWNYFHEEGMLAQSMQVLSLRFQNKLVRPGTDPLASFNTSPLRPLSNFMWGYIQAETERLSVRRRNYEYDHHYGISLHGKAVIDFQPADSRKSFMGAFNRLLNLSVQFFRQKDDTTVAADAFPVKNALRDVHIVLSEGAHNQFGDLPWQARVEMYLEQYILSRPEMREFLGGRSMVPYREPWMENVDTMKRLQNWTDVSVQHFNNLARTGEAILLSVRHGAWNSPEINAADADNWAVAHRDLIQEYVHSYRATTGVDLADPKQVDDTMPSVHLRKRLEKQTGRAA